MMDFKAGDKSFSLARTDLISFKVPSMSMLSSFTRVSHSLLVDTSIVTWIFQVNFSIRKLILALILFLNQPATHV